MGHTRKKVITKEQAESIRMLVKDWDDVLTQEAIREGIINIIKKR